MKCCTFPQEKLKLEIETRQSENGMLQSRVDTVEENCHFLEGQVSRKILFFVETNRKLSMLYYVLSLSKTRVFRCKLWKGRTVRRIRL